MQNEDIDYLEYKIKEATDNGEPIEKFVVREINWLKQQLEEFLQKSKEQGKDIETDFDIAEIEVRQYAAMRQLAQKIDYPTDEYDEKIIKIQKRIFGEDNWENFFGTTQAESK